MNAILEFLNNSSIMMTIAGILIIAFAKSIIKIYKMGVTDKSHQVTREELIEFENQMRTDMRGYTGQIQKVVLEACLKVIDSKLKDIDDVKDAAVDMRIMKTELETEIKSALEKYDEIKSVSDSVRSLGNKVSRLEYNNENSTIRRTEK